MRPSAGVAAGITVLTLAATSAAQDIRFSVPLEYTSGFTTGANPRPFVGGIRASLLARFGSQRTLLAGPAGAFVYEGTWNAVVGARAGMRVPRLGTGDAGLYLFAEALKGSGRAPVSLSLVADLPVRPAFYARFGVSFTRDLEREQNEIALVVGLDLARWAADLFGDDGPRGVQP